MKKILFALSILSVSFAQAEPFKLENNVLFYSTGEGTKVLEIDWGHEEELLQILRKHQEIDTLILKSEGGIVEVADTMADLVIDAELNTFVEENCESACVTIFLAGKNRIMEIGAKIGFQASWWPAENIQSYYQNLQFKQLRQNQTACGIQGEGNFWMEEYSLSDTKQVFV